jgi:hypothetical protein
MSPTQKKPRKHQDRVLRQQVDINCPRCIVYRKQLPTNQAAVPVSGLGRCGMHKCSAKKCLNEESCCSSPHPQHNPSSWHFLFIRHAGSCDRE